MSEPAQNPTRSLPSPFASLLATIDQDKAVRIAWSSLADRNSQTWQQSLAEAPQADLSAMLRLAEAQAKPADRAEIGKAVAVLTGLPSRAQSADEAKASMGIYLLGLDDVPGELLAQAVKRAAKECRFRPTPSELREMIGPEIAERSLRLARLRKAVSQISAATEADR
jgi:hypothetical protein